MTHALRLRTKIKENSFNCERCGAQPPNESNSLDFMNQRINSVYSGSYCASLAFINKLTTFNLCMMHIDGALCVSPVARDGALAHHPRREVTYSRKHSTQFIFLTMDAADQ